MSTGQEFVKRIGPFGAGLFVVLFVLFLVIAFTSGNNLPLQNYEPPHDSIYYSQSSERMSELLDELQSNVIPQLDGENSFTLESGKITVTIDEEHYFNNRSAILEHFDDTLFTFERNE